MSDEPLEEGTAFLIGLEGIGPDSRIAGYLVEDHIGWGGMAVVVKAVDERLGRRVALKILAPAMAADEAFRRRFIKESRAAAAVDDPHIIPVFEAGQAGGVLFIAMRYVAGGDLRTLVRRSGPLSASRATEVVSAVASALDAAHRHGLVHRDVKPANMLVDVQPGRPAHVYLSDFGLSKDVLSSTALTASGQLLGTPDYMAPEQILDQQVDGRADQYALACAAFELLTGAPPFERGHLMAVMYAQLSDPPPSLAAARPGLPGAADAVLARALAKSAADRYPTCRDFAESLRAALGMRPWDFEPDTGPQDRPDEVPPGAGNGSQHSADTIDRPRARDGREREPTGPQTPPRTRRAMIWQLVSLVLPVAVLAAAGLYFLARPSAAPCPAGARCLTGVGQGPRALAVTRNGRLLYVADSRGSAVTPVSIRTGAARTPIRVGNDPVALAFSGNGSTLYVADHGGGTVTPIAVATATARKAITTGGQPSALALTPDGGTLYVATGSTVTAVNTRAAGTQGTARVAIHVGPGPLALAMSKDGKTLYAASSDGRVTAVATASDRPVARIRVGARPSGLAISPDGRWLYVANSGDGTITPISTATNAPGTPIPVGGVPTAMAVAPDGQTLYVADSSGTVTPVSTATGLAGATIRVAAATDAMAIASNDVLYAANASDVVTVRPPPVGPRQQVGFQVMSMTYISKSEGWALGTVACGASRCLQLLHTTGAGIWTQVQAPASSAGSFGVCPTRRPCMQQVAFVGGDGYAFDPSASVSMDSGISWRPVVAPADVSSLAAGAPQFVAQVTSTAPGCAGGPYPVQGTSAGPSGWYPLNPPAISGACPPVLYTTGYRIALVGYGNPARVDKATAQIWLSEYKGTNWRAVKDVCGSDHGYASAVALAQQRVLALLCQHDEPGTAGRSGSAWIRISTNDGAAFQPLRLLPRDKGPNIGTIVHYQLAAATNNTMLVAETGTTGSKLLLTQDGGRTWQCPRVLPGAAPVILVGYESPKVGRVAQGNTVWTTHTGGKHWTSAQFEAG